MDRVGVDVLGDYPDWSRGPLTLDLRNKQTHRRFLITFNRVMFHTVLRSSENLSNELVEANKLFTRLDREIGVQSIHRLGFRQYACSKHDGSFEQLQKSMEETVVTIGPGIKTSLRGKVDDFGFVVEVTHTKGWKYTMRFGPMEKKQWFELVPHSLDTFENAESLEKYRDEFPSTFTFFDIDCFKHDVPKYDADALLGEMASESAEIMQSLSGEMQ